MTKPKVPYTCDFCAKEISSEKQYVLEAFEGKSSFSDPRIRAKSKLDCCHKCFLNICENGLKPTWIKEQKNPNYVAGSKKGSGKEYYILVQEPNPQQKIETTVQ